VRRASTWVRFAKVPTVHLGGHWLARVLVPCGVDLSCTTGRVRDWYGSSAARGMASSGGTGVMDVERVTDVRRFESCLPASALRYGEVPSGNGGNCQGQMV
jgi:hypothetical protein